MVEINGVSYNTNETRRIYEAAEGYYFVTVSGMDYFNRNFTSISADFYFGGILT